MSRTFQACSSTDPKVMSTFFFNMIFLEIVELPGSSTSHTTCMVYKKRGKLGKMGILSGLLLCDLDEEWRWCHYSNERFDCCSGRGKVYGYQSRL